ncbi:MAG TPA: glycosyltransferase family protein [Candidatus Binatia bacterium]
MQPARIALVVVARQGSTRLPGKALADVAGKPMIGHIIERVKKSRGIGAVVLATTKNREDEPLLAAARAFGAGAFAGSGEDVLDRVHQAAREYRADAVVHVGGDCPFADPAVVERALEVYFSGPFDYATNTLVQTFPSGLDVQVFSRSALARACEEARLPAERHHLSAYFHRHRGEFKIKNFENETNLAALRWTLDYPEDLAFVREVYRRLYRPGEIFHQADILRLLARRPELAAINRVHALGLAERPAAWDSEGYLVDLQRDLVQAARQAVEADVGKDFTAAEKFYADAASLAGELGERAHSLARARDGA